MGRSFLTMSLIAAALSIFGCERPEPAPVTSDAGSPPMVPPSPPVSPTEIPPPAEVPTAGTTAGSGGADDVERMPSKSAGMTSSPKTVAFLEANRGVVKLQDDLRDLLLSVTDDESARQAAAKLPAQIEAWDTTQKSATAMFLTLSDSEKNGVMGLAADEIVAKGPPSGENMMQIMKRLAGSPQRPILNDSLTRLRDVFLSQHSIYAPRRAREKMAEELGAIGSPLLD